MKKYILVVLMIFLFAYAENRGDFCGTPEALKDFQEGRLPIRPTLSGPEQFVNRTFFRVHYTTQGNDAVTQEYAESTASYVTYCWAKEIDTLGWVAPPPDYGQGGDDRYDFYIMALSSGIMGSTHPESNYPTPYPDGVSSYIRLSNVYSGNDLKVTIAHEFCHACEFRYSVDEGTWWMENCATWMEDLVYDNVNYYVGYLSSPPNPLGSPHLAINSGSGLYWYAGAIWAMFLGDCYGNDCLRQIWVYQGTVGGENSLQGIDQILTTQYSSNLITALKKYSVWRYFTGSRADTVHYFKEGNLWPQVTILRNHTSYPASGDQGSYPVSNPGGTDYIQFSNGGGKLFVSFNAQSVYRWSCHVVGYRPNNLSSVFEMPLNSIGNGNDSFPWQDYEHFALIPVATQWEYNTGSLPFNYTADIRILHDVGVQRVTGISSLADSGAVINPQATVKNFGLYSENFPVRFTIGDYYTNTQNITLAPSDSSILNFPSCTLRVRGYNAYKCTTMLSTDERITNNSISDRVFVRVKDVGTIAILAPVGNVTQGSLIHPEATIKNYGNLRENFTMQFTIGTWQVTQPTSLAAGLEFDIVFDSIWIPSSIGQYMVKCSTRLTNDINPNNDRVVSTCNVTPPAVNEEELKPINTPYFVFGNRKIRLPEGASLSETKIEVYDVQGKLVYKGKLNGYSEINLTSGCYILRIQSNTQIHNYKAVTIK